jgi:HEPN domain-containing protein
MENADSSNRCRIWMEQAFFDLAAANLSLNNGYHEWAAYQAEQAAEKALKAVVVHAGWRPPRMHKLGMLFGICNQASAEFRQTKFNFKHLESFTFISRYPFLIPGKNKAPHDLIGHMEAKTAVDEATDVVTKIKDIMQISPCSKNVDFVAINTKIERVYSPLEVSERIEEVKSVLMREFNPEKIILFGRFAREFHQPVSGTMDILVIANTELPFVERIVKAREATRGGSIIIEPLIYTPEEFKLMTEDEAEGFIESALEEGITLFENKTTTK